MEHYERDTGFGAGSGGLISDLIVGLIGALVGGFALGDVYQGTVGLVGSIVVAFTGRRAPVDGTSVRRAGRVRIRR
jgi:hypothetical protein